MNDMNRKSRASPQVTWPELHRKSLRSPHQPPGETGHQAELLVAGRGQGDWRVQPIRT